MAHVQSYDQLITRAILSHYLATLAFIVQQSHINARPIARLMRLHRKTVALDRATVVRLLFHMRLFRQQFTIQI